VSYFTAVIEHSGATWRARDVEVDEAESLDDLVDVLRSVSLGGPVLVVVEHEDEWFALIRIDGEDDPRLFVSNLGIALRSPFSGILSPVADVEPDDGRDDEDDRDPIPDDTDEDAPVSEDDLDDDLDQDEPEAPIWGGELEIIEDLGVEPRRLRDLVERNLDDPGAVLGEIGDQVGFTELLEVLR
jgi:putative tRNA adenosine deaminase-associated protein